MPENAKVCQYIKRRLEGMQQSRYNFASHWQEIIDYMIPNRQGIITRYQPGIKRMDLIYDSTGIHALGLLAAALHGFLTNPATPWFALKPENDALTGDEEVVRWMQDVETLLYAIYNQTNWSTEVHEAYQDLAGFGTANLFQGDDPDRIVYFDNRSLGECFIAENHLGQTDVLFRVYSMTARQMVQEWGEKLMSEKVLKKNESHPDDQFDIIHAVYPRTDRNPAKKLRTHLPFASIYIEADSDWVIDEGGFHEFPYCNPRWSRMSGEVYGRSPGMVALPDVKMLNVVKETYIRAAQKALDPPLMIPNDGFLNPIRTAPGSLNIIKSSTVADKLMPFPTAQNIRVGDEMVMGLQDNIRRIFYNDMLQMPNGQDMTATEVIQRVEERLRILGPVMGRLQTDLLAPTIARTFGIAYRRGLVPRPPAILAGANLKIEYVSPLAKAQRLAQAQGITKALEFLLPYAQVMPQVLDNIDPDATARYIFDVYSAPQKVLRGKKQVDQMRSDRAAQQKQLQATREAMAASEAAPRLGKAIEPNSPLAHLVGAMSNQGGQ